MVDFAAGHLTSEQSHPIVAALDAALGRGRDGVRFHPGVEYRHLCVVPRDLGDAECVPPHDLTGQPIVLPSGPAAAKLIALMDASKPVVAAAAAEVGSMATQIWLWGQGIRRSCPTSPPGTASPVGCRRRSTSCAASACSPASRWSTFPARPPGFDNDYAAQRDAALASLADRDLFLLHVEATDEAGHQGAVDEKVTSLERWDDEIIGPLVDALGDEPYRILLLPDHATPCAVRTHTSDPVPYLLFSTDEPGAGGEYTERGVAGCDPVAAHDLMARLLR